MHSEFQQHVRIILIVHPHKRVIIMLICMVLRDITAVMVTAMTLARLQVAALYLMKVLVVIASLVVIQSVTLTHSAVM